MACLLNSQMEMMRPGRQEFYKIMMPGDDTQLPLPRACCEKLNALLSEVATITSCKGTCEVELKKGNNELISFGRGWEAFFHEHNLSLGTLIIFKTRGSMHFTAKVFDPTTDCLKEFPVNSTQQNDKRTGIYNTGVRLVINAGEEPTYTTCHCSTSQFTTVIKLRKDNRVYIPMEFAKAHDFFRKKSIILKDSAGEEWTVEVKLYSQKRVRLADGWSDFCESKRLKVGDCCTFGLRESADRKEFLYVYICPSEK